MEKAIDKNVESVREQMRKRAEVGLKKYGVTTERGDLTVFEWIQHAQDESMDSAVYLEKLKWETKRLVEEVELLREWKRQATEVMPDYQAIGELLKMPLGTRMNKVLIPIITELVYEIRTYREVIKMAWEDRRINSPDEYVGKLAAAKCNLPER